ncbi:hypothetical protein [Amycolatopsis sp.]|uniref:hypothetical protein n=1 Tax=Amycolatopsis sp. TaxID=37632 RepID=UPI0039C8AFE6
MKFKLCTEALALWRGPALAARGSFAPRGHRNPPEGGGASPDHSRYLVRSEKSGKTAVHHPDKPDNA